MARVESWRRLMYVCPEGQWYLLHLKRDHIFENTQNIQSTHYVKFD